MYTLIDSTLIIVPFKDGLLKYSKPSIHARKLLNPLSAFGLLALPCFLFLQKKVCHLSHSRP